MLVSLGIILCPDVDKVVKRKNLESNLKAQNLQLDAEDKKAIAALDCNDRLVSPEGLAPEWD